MNLNSYVNVRKNIAQDLMRRCITEIKEIPRLNWAIVSKKRKAYDSQPLIKAIFSSMHKEMLLNLAEYDARKYLWDELCLAETVLKACELDDSVKLTVGDLKSLNVDRFVEERKLLEKQLNDEENDGR